MPNETKRQQSAMIIGKSQSRKTEYECNTADSIATYWISSATTLLYSKIVYFQAFMNQQFQSSNSNKPARHRAFYHVCDV